MMPTKSYINPENKPETISEPAVVYETATINSSPADDWNPNVPFQGTQDEWWEHFHRIEKGNFMTLEEFDRKFETWKTNYLASKLK